MSETGRCKSVCGYLFALIYKCAMILYLHSIECQTELFSKHWLDNR